MLNDNSNNNDNYNNKSESLYETKKYFKALGSGTRAHILSEAKHKLSDIDNTHWIQRIIAFDSKDITEAEYVFSQLKDNKLFRWIKCTTDKTDDPLNKATLYDLEDFNMIRANLKPGQSMRFVCNYVDVVDLDNKQECDKALQIFKEAVFSLGQIEGALEARLDVIDERSHDNTAKLLSETLFPKPGKSVLEEKFPRHELAEDALIKKTQRGLESLLRDIMR